MVNSAATYATEEIAAVDAEAKAPEAIDYPYEAVLRLRDPNLVDEIVAGVEQRLGRQAAPLNVSAIVRGEINAYLSEAYVHLGKARVADLALLETMPDEAGEVKLFVPDQIGSLEDRIRAHRARYLIDEMKAGLHRHNFLSRVLLDSGLRSGQTLDNSAFRIQFSEVWAKMDPAWWNREIYLLDEIFPVEPIDLAVRAFAEMLTELTPLGIELKADLLAHTTSLESFIGYLQDSPNRNLYLEQLTQFAQDRIPKLGRSDLIKLIEYKAWWSDNLPQMIFSQSTISSFFDKWRRAVDTLFSGQEKLHTRALLELIADSSKLPPSAKAAFLSVLLLEYRIYLFGSPAFWDPSNDGLGGRSRDFFWREVKILARIPPAQATLVSSGSAFEPAPEVSASQLEEVFEDAPMAAAVTILASIRSDTFPTSSEIPDETLRENGFSPRQIAEFRRVYPAELARLNANPQHAEIEAAALRAISRSLKVK